MASTGTGVVIGSHSVKVVQARRKGGVLRLTKVANLKLDSAMAAHPMDARKIERLGSLIAGAEARPGEALLGLTGRDLIVRYTHVPPVPDWRLGMLMKFEIEEVSEQSGGEVSADWVSLDLPESVSADKTVLVALAKNAALEPRIEVLKKANLRLRGACPNAVAAFHAFVSTAHYEPGEVTLIMHIGAENTDIAIQQDGRLLFARNVAGGGSLFTETIMTQFGAPYDRAEKMKFQKVDVSPRGTVKYSDSLSEKVSNSVLGVTGQFVSMVHSSVMFCKAQTKLKDLDVDRVILVGGAANLKGFRAYMETNLGMPVAVYDPTKAVDLSGLPPEQAAIFDKDPTGLTVAIGLASLALERGPMAVEIMPDEYRKRREFRDRGVWMLGAAAAVAVLIILLFLTSGRDHGAVEEEADELRLREVELSNLNSKLTRMQDVAKSSKGKWAALRDEGQAGPCLLKALAWTNEVILGEDFKSIHVTRVKCQWRDEELDKKTWRRNWDPEDTGDGGGDEDRDTGRKDKMLVRGVVVDFEAEISDLAASQEAVFDKFGTKLGALLRAKELSLLRQELKLTDEDLGITDADRDDVEKAIGSKEIEDEEVRRTLGRVAEFLPRVILKGPKEDRERLFKYQIIFAYPDSQ